MTRLVVNSSGVDNSARISQASGLCLLSAPMKHNPKCPPVLCLGILPWANSDESRLSTPVDNHKLALLRCSDCLAPVPRDPPMNRILLPVVGVLLASSSAIAQGIVRPASAAPVAPQQNTVVWLQPVRPIGTYGPLTWTRGPIIGTGVYANRPWVGTPWIVPTARTWHTRCRWATRLPSNSTTAHRLLSRRCPSHLHLLLPQRANPQCFPLNSHSVTLR